MGKRCLFEKILHKHTLYKFSDYWSQGFYLKTPVADWVDMVPNL